MLFDELRTIQRQHGYLPDERLKDLSRRIDVPLYKIQGVASFYPHFHLTPQPRVRAGVCTDMSCHLNGSTKLLEALKERSEPLGKNISLYPISCLGQCDRAPAFCLNDVIYPNMTPDDAEALISTAMAGFDLASAVTVPVTVNLESNVYGDGPKYGALRKLVEARDWDGVISALKAAALPGMGGAGFPTGVKWDVVRAAPGPIKYVVCNADESEPGTIKDRYIMEHLPHMVIEGMIIAAIVTGAQSGFLYVRHEYELQEKILEQEIENCRKMGLLGQRILGSDLSFDIEIFISPGGYICGEGSALLEAIEGKRAEPRIKPPNSATVGLWGKPTALNNVETFATIAQILERGADWYKSAGLHGAAGLKFVGVSGDVRKPGVFEVPMGTLASDVIMKLAGGPRDGKKVKAWAPSGAASGFLPASMMDVALDFKSMSKTGSMLGSAAIVVCAEGRCMLDMALNCARFFRNESCGKCVPCRVGSQKMVDILTSWSEGWGGREDLELIDELSETLKLTSICGLGQFIPYSVLSVIKHFREDVEAHILEKRCPDGVCPMRA